MRNVVYVAIKTVVVIEPRPNVFVVFTFKTIVREPYGNLFVLFQLHLVLFTTEVNLVLHLPLVFLVLLP
jgi:hypothetical protein